MSFVILPGRVHGVCGGVARAVAIARQEAARHGGLVYSIGQVVHNPLLMEELSRQGLQVVAEASQAPDGSVVLLRAHGSTTAERLSLVERGCILVDTTCKNLLPAHRLVDKAFAEGGVVIICGDGDHVECQALKDNRDRVVVVTDPSQLPSDLCADTRPVTVLCQSSTPPAAFDAFLERLRPALDPACRVTVRRSVCPPVMSRHEALQELLPRVDAVMVVGGRHSANSRGLYETARRKVPAWYVTGPGDIDPAWLADVSVLGLMGGASTPDEALNRVTARLRELGGMPAAQD